MTELLEEKSYSSESLCLLRLRKALKKAWGKDTAQGGEWDERCPALNQCAVTSLVVQEFFGGDLLRCTTKNGSSHYWNKLPDGQEVDFTSSQFIHSGDRPNLEEKVIREREYVLSFPDTKARYEILLNRVREVIEDWE